MSTARTLRTRTRIGIRPAPTISKSKARNNGDARNVSSVSSLDSGGSMVAKNGGLLEFRASKPGGSGVTEKKEAGAQAGGEVKVKVERDDEDEEKGVDGNIMVKEEQQEDEVVEEEKQERAELSDSDSELSELSGFESEEEYAPPAAAAHKEKERLIIPRKRARKPATKAETRKAATPAADAEVAEKPRRKSKAKTKRKLEDEEENGGTEEEVEVEDGKEVKRRPKPKSTAKKPTSASSKRQKLTKYSVGTTPFPDHPHPTPEECKLVVDLLSSVHGPSIRPDKPPPPNLLVTGCGEVPSILDALVRTLLSANTNAKNSNTAFRGLVEKFGLSEKGSVDWEKVRTADTKDVFEAIKAGGLANIKSARIKKILQQVWEENRERRRRKQERGAVSTATATATATAAGGTGTGVVGGADNATRCITIVKEEDGEVIKQETSSNDDDPTYDIDYDSSDDLSLDYLHLLTDEQAMTKLLSFDGIGFKTASCVMLFCMARESFAVDTHVFRIARFLNWVPPEKANRETTFWHLDAKIPDEYKYPLHALFIKHGRSCLWCRAGGPLTYEEALKNETSNTTSPFPEDVDMSDAEPKKIKKQVGIRKVKKEIKVEDEIEDFKEEEKPKRKRVKKEVGSPAPVPTRVMIKAERCPLEDLVRRFHGTRKGKAKLESVE